jgi:hypothetical protein
LQSQRFQLQALQQLLQLLNALRAYVGSLPKDCERTLYL